MKKEDKALITIDCFEEGVGTPVNNQEHVIIGSIRPAYYIDGFTPLPKGFKGGCELVDTVRRTVYENDIFRVVKPGELEALKNLGRELSKCYLSPTAPPVKEEKTDMPHVATTPVNQYYDELKKRITNPAKPLKAIDESQNYRYYIDGKEVTQQQYDDVEFADRHIDVNCKYEKVKAIGEGVSDNLPNRERRYLNEASKRIEKDYSIASDTYKRGYKAGFSDAAEFSFIDTQQNTVGKVSVEEVVNCIDSYFNLNSIKNVNARELINQIKKL